MGDNPDVFIAKHVPLAVFEGTGRVEGIVCTGEVDLDSANAVALQQLAQSPGVCAESALVKQRGAAMVEGREAVDVIGGAVEGVEGDFGHGSVVREAI
jgi:hypothetical protein